MVKYLRSLLSFAFLTAFLWLGNTCYVSAQGTSNKGTDFWLAYGNHVAGYSSTIGMDMVVYITSDVNTSGIMSVGGVDYPFQVQANTITNVPVPQNAYIGNSEGKIINKGIHITSLKPVVVYAHIYDSSVSGATLVLPTNTLGKEYYSLNFEQVSNSANSNSFFVVVAVEDNTQIVITPSVNTLGGLQAGVQSAPISLNKGEIFQVFGTKTTTSNPFRGTDLTGSVIKSVSTSSEPCKKIAVFSGSGKISIGCPANNGQAGSADNLFQQVYPTATWGHSFVTVPSKNRNYDVYRIFKSDPNAIVKLNGSIIPPANFINDFYYEFPSQEVNYVESDKTIQVAIYPVTQGKSINCTSISGDVGDPEMIFLNPLEQTLTKITMYSTPLNLILRHYINVVIPTAAVSSFTIDGISQALNFGPAPNSAQFSYAQIEVTEGPHNLTANTGFNAIAYGFGSAESYGYAAGASLVSAGLQARVSSTGQPKATGCVNEKYNLDITLTYRPEKLTLDLDNGQPAIQIPVKLIKSEIVNGTSNYTYEVLNDVSFTAIKRYGVKLFAEKSAADGCGSTDEFNLEFDVSGVPQAAFTSDSQQTCVASAVTFTDSSISNSATINKWYWNFGDGSTEIKTTSDPVQHSYSASGDYQVSLIVETDAGCQSSSVAALTVHVNKMPDALFDFSSLRCATTPIQFTDKSVANEGVITKWIWNFGDGNTSAEQNPYHSFAAAGKYMVKLSVETDKACLSTAVSMEVNVNPLPTVNFEVPDFCLADGSAQFTNTTIISDGTDARLTYLWDFGDPQANAQRPNSSTLKNASHRYTKAGRYTVTLTVKSGNGCEKALSKPFVVNGGVPKADFTIKNDGMLCSGQPVEFEDNVKVELDEEVTKIEWIYDFANYPDVKEIDDDPAMRSSPARTYSHTYPIFTFPASKTYQIKMLAYTGGNCVNTITKYVTVFAVPAVDFELPASCLSEGIAVFKDKSTIANTNGPFTYLWDFGDSKATAQKPNTSTDKDAQHKYSEAGDYVVTLTVTSSTGCSSTISKALTVSGSIPEAKFAVVNPGRLCSDAPVIFEDRTVVDFGEITKIDWYYDYSNDPSLKSTDDNTERRGAPPKQYSYTYPVFYAPATKTVTVRMVAYSGASCMDDELQTITLHAVPEVQFDNIPDICSDAGAIQLTQAEEKHAVLTGAGTYSGKGVTPAGVFDPAAAGVGTHTLTYTFVADNGCTGFNSQTITVNELPTVAIRPHLFVLDDGRVELPAVASGSNLVYKWAPSTYLDQDDVLNPVAVPRDDITYTLTVTNDKGCTATSHIFIKVLKFPEVPNSFTPNGDGINDTWNIKYLESYPDATVEVFNRYGERVFKSVNYLSAWDGTKNGSELPIGTYYYILNPKNGRKIISGSITIIR